MDISMIYEAQQVLDSVITKTPIVKADKLEENLFIKAENLQSTGAFKLRGAYYCISKLSDAEKECGVIAASAGNHAQGVAYACREMGIKGTIVMPKTAPLSKIDATRSYGVQVELQGDVFNDAYLYAQNLQKLTNATFIEPFNDERIIAGQGTIGLEIIEKMPDVGVVLVPIGGGGLASGIAYAIKALHPKCRVYGVQAENAASMKLSLEHGRPIVLDQVATIADGIAVKTPGDITFDLCRQCLDGVVTVSEEEIAAAILLLSEKLKMVAEGAGATAVAASIFHKVDTKGEKCVAVLSGGNIDVNFLSKIIDLGLIKTGRKAFITMNVLDKPGNLSRVINVIAEQGANIVSVNHNRIQSDILYHQCHVSLEIETNNQKHILQVIRALEENGFQPQLR